MTAEELLDLFGAVAGAVAGAMAGLDGTARRRRTERPGQYHLDLVADRAALAVLAGAPVAVVSEESGHSGLGDAPVTVVIDPVDGSTNASRGIPYWGTSLCALDGEGPLASLVVNQVTGSRTVAVRGKGVWRDGSEARPSAVRRLEESVVGISGYPARPLPWRQYRALGSAALALCDVAGGGLEAFVDVTPAHAPWDYLGGLLACTEAGAAMVAVDGRPLTATDPSTGRPLVETGASGRRQLAAAAHPELLEAVLAAQRAAAW